MKSHVVLWTMALVVLFAITAVAADISGKWVAQIPVTQGTQETIFNFKVSGSTLTGSMSNPWEQEISEGKVSAYEVSFVIIRKFNEMEMKTVYKGKIAGNEIQFTREMQRPPDAPGGGGGGGRGGGPQMFTARRAQ